MHEMYNQHGWNWLSFGVIVLRYILFIFGIWLCGVHPSANEQYMGNTNIGHS